MNHLNPSETVSLFFLFVIASQFISISATLEYLSKGSSLSVQRLDDIIVSPDNTFTAGFHSVGDNAYTFAVWFTKSISFTPIWMANRDQPVNGRRSTLSLQKGGNLVLMDAGRIIVWKTDTSSASPVQLRLLNTGNLLLQTSANTTLWQSFDFPTDTLLPLQVFTKEMKLVASRSQTNYSSGFYSFFFDDDNILHLLYSSPNISSAYWPDPGLLSWEAERSTYNSSWMAVFDLSGYFQSSDDLKFFASDFGVGPIRRLTIDHDGNLRLYSLDEKGAWGVSWQAIAEICSMHGLCGPNSICVYEQSQRRCSCPPGFKLKDPTDLSQGCWPTFKLSCDPLDSKFITLPNTEFYGYDLNFTRNISLQQCMNKCLELCSCKAVLYKALGKKARLGQCFPKTQLHNGFHSPAFNGTVHLKVPINGTMSDRDYAWLETTVLQCDPNAHVELDRTYKQKQENSSLKYLFWFVAIIGGSELICMYMGWWYIHKNNSPSVIEKWDVISATGFKRFRYTELKKATQNFSEVIGRGGAGVVYKGVLPDERVVAVKRLEGVNQGEAQFLAEIGTIGRINHMNLIQVWGFCAERKHKLLVYEYMERGTLADNLSSNALDWEKRFKIAIGTAKGLAYLHEECLEWVLHCDVKPQNILLDSNYHSKVADFGLSKLLDRCGIKHLNISKIRGTRGYMAPEWILNQPITSKVDVYSYGIVLLEMVTGRRAFEFDANSEGDVKEEFQNLVAWVREKMCASNENAGRIEEIINPEISSTYDAIKMEILIEVALQCVKEDKDARPTMTQVVEMLLRHEYD
ncbi:hypothetical protein AAC387_Pa11g0099 [Persea americana]